MASQELLPSHTCGRGAGGEGAFNQQRPLHIALLTHSINPRGGVVHTLELANALHNADHTVTIMAPAEAGQTLFRDMPCEVQLIPVAAASKDTVEMVASRIDAYVSHLTSTLQHQHFDILHAQDSISGNALANLKERSLIAGFVRTVHHLDNFTNPQLATWQMRAWREADTVLCVSQLWRAHMRSEHGVDTQLVHNGVDAERYSTRTDASDARVRGELNIGMNKPVFLAVGGIEERKNTLRILQAFIQFHARMPAARLVIAGGASLLDHNSYSREFHTLLRESGLSFGAGQAVHITGTLIDADMPALFRAADVLLMPSLREGFGLVVLEALASGTPVVVSQIAPFTEYLDEALCHWCDPSDADSIADAMRIAASATRGAALRELAASLIDTFSWQRSAEGHVALYRKHLAESTSALADATT
ncbi:MSMEG_0565 family glycosyltransferase [Uliginosibacterium sp. H3]|uniref:MSMEG_0565 family glycosyltransferase n=1 Tax=Uliginosibacterium silvisoli TaxID=3114758 RepID=A0ABU6K2W2_9RHOO|nr:MSMEG_0565 family glycosyltransferase [Uliginosibacterium sp. H3]